MVNQSLRGGPIIMALFFLIINIIIPVIIIIIIIIIMAVQDQALQTKYYATKILNTETASADYANNLMRQ